MHFVFKTVWLSEYEMDRFTIRVLLMSLYTDIKCGGGITKILKSVYEYDEFWQQVRVLR